MGPGSGDLALCLDCNRPRPGTCVLRDLVLALPSQKKEDQQAPPPIPTFDEYLEALRRNQDFYYLVGAPPAAWRALGDLALAPGSDLQCSAKGTGVRATSPSHCLPRLCDLAHCLQRQARHLYTEAAKARELAGEPQEPEQPDPAWLKRRKRARLSAQTATPHSGGWLGEGEVTPGTGRDEVAALVASQAASQAAAEAASQAAAQAASEVAALASWMSRHLGMVPPPLAQQQQQQPEEQQQQQQEDPPGEGEPALEERGEDEVAHAPHGEDEAEDDEAQEDEGAPPCAGSSREIPETQDIV